MFIKQKQSWIRFNNLLLIFCLLISLQCPVEASMGTNDSQQENADPNDAGITRNKIVTAQFECYQKIMKDNTQSREGSIDPGEGWGGGGVMFLIVTLTLVAEAMCNRTWDGWLCWDDTKAGVVSEQHCPDYFIDFDPSGEI